MSVMSDLSDEELARFQGPDWMDEDVEVRMVVEIQRHRAAQRADAERVRSVVIAAFSAQNNVVHGMLSQADGVAIADRVAAELATAAPASAPVLSAEERETLAWLLSYVPTPDSVGGSAEARLVRLGVACVRRLLGGGAAK